MKQEFVEGPTAYQLQNAADVAQGRRVIPSMSSSRAQRTLQEAGLTADQADARIRALERFYATTHNDVVAFQDANGLTGLWNRRNTGILMDVRPVGFDYNHGGNVIWSPTEKKFVIFDW